MLPLEIHQRLAVRVRIVVSLSSDLRLDCNIVEARRYCSCFHAVRVAGGPGDLNPPDAVNLCIRVTGEILYLDWVDIGVTIYQSDYSEPDPVVCLGVECV
jgi:hypothetical protein